MDKDVLTRSWKLLTLRGLIGIVFGIVAIAWPEQTIVVVVVLWGVWALVDGIGLVASAFTDGIGKGQRMLFLGMAAVALLVAFLAFTRPGMAAAALTWVLGVWLLVRGAFELVGALAAAQASPRWLLVLGALRDIALGALFIAYPGKAVVGIVWLLGVIAVAWGIVYLVLGLPVRRQAAQLPAAVVTG